ncbi:hypothetical protein ACRRTK_008379 [Alexandromys fortis]
MGGQTAQGQEEDTIFVSSDSSLLEAVAAGDHLGSSLESVGRKRLPAFPRSSPGSGADGTAVMFTLARLLDFQKTKYARRGASSVQSSFHICDPVNNRESPPLGTTGG